MRKLLTMTMLGAGTILAVASGCTITKVGMPVGAFNVKAPKPENDDYGAPRVAAPLDATPFLTKPCTVLTPPQLQVLDLPAGTSDTDSSLAKSSGPGCFWTNSDSRSTVGFGFMTGNKNGLSDTYRGRDRFRGYFTPTDVDGYPAVFNDVGDYRADGTCGMTTGISDTLTFIVSERGRLGVKSCDRVRQIASMVIKTVKSGG